MAVIGAGVSGLVVARELKREGHIVVVFEKAHQLGGVWLYDPRIESDPLSLDPTRKIVQNSLYHSLRTNLPRQVMNFSDYPFKVRENGDPRNFPGHEEVLRFLIDFANDFELVDLIRFGNEVTRVERVDSVGNQWVVESRGEYESGVELFEAVVVCNGHHTKPVVAHVPGIEKWPGKQIHSHNYRHPMPYEDQVVIIIGGGPSARDISREIAKVAKEVHLSSRSPNITQVSKLENHPNIWQHSKILKACEDGTILFEDGSYVPADIILHCTGYNYSFPFLNTNGALSIEDNRVGPLYKHVFLPSLAPRLSFVGIPFRGFIFRIYELQSKWIAGVLSSKLQLPSEEEMLADVEHYYKHMLESGIPKHHTHLLGHSQFEYQKWLATQIGVPPGEGLTSMYDQLLEYVFSNEGFRDDFDPENFMKRYI